MSRTAEQMIAEMDELLGAVETAINAGDKKAEWIAVYAVSRHYYGLAPEHVYDTFVNWQEENRKHAENMAELDALRAYFDGDNR
jgi:hypothetical protein